MGFFLLFCRLACRRLLGRWLFGGALGDDGGGRHMV
jgi:hypothetical protein